MTSLPSLRDIRGTKTLPAGATSSFAGLNPFLIAIHTFAYTAYVKLHGPMGQRGDPISYARCLDAAQHAMKDVHKVIKMDVSDLSALLAVSTRCRSPIHHH